MSIQTKSVLETEIVHFFDGPEQAHDLPEIVRRFRTLADDASIKAELLRLNFEGVLEITSDWKFRRAAATTELS